jgi:ATP-binding cassette subfamily B protein
MDSRLTLAYYGTAGLGALGPLGASLAMKYLIDGLTRGQEMSMSVTIPMLVVWALAMRYAVVLAQNVVFYGLNRTYLDYLFRYKIQNAITWWFYKKVANLDVAYFEDPEVQNLLTKVRDTSTWRLPDYLRTLTYLLSSLVEYGAAFVVLLTFGWWVPVLVTVITAPRLVLRARYGSLQWSIWGSGAPQAKKLWYFSWVLQEPQVVREMKIFQSQKRLLAKFNAIQEKLLAINKKPLDKYLRVLMIPPILETVLIFGIGYTFLAPTVAGMISVGSFTLLVSLIGQLNRSAASMAVSLGEMYENDLFAEDFFRVLNLPRLIKEVRKPVSFDEIKPPRIEFRNVDFKYPGSGGEVLKNVSFTVEPGENVALVGPNGAGKTTIIKLICRFYDVTGGEILVNGVNIRKLKLANWYKFLGTLFQDFVQYHFTVRENIVLGSPGRRDQEGLRGAAEKSGAAEFIRKFPKRYGQMLGREYEEGKQLSIGQWQKLAIARAFYDGSPVLILDEPTSAIDAEAEYEIFRNLHKFYRDKSLVLVSHRFSTVRNADKILVIDHGEIIERGPHEELLKLDGKYARMFRVQAKGYE